MLIPGLATRGLSALDAAPIALPKVRLTSDIHCLREARFVNRCAHEIPPAALLLVGDAPDDVAAGAPALRDRYLESDGPPAARDGDVLGDGMEAAVEP